MINIHLSGSFYNLGSLAQEIFLSSPKYHLFEMTVTVTVSIILLKLLLQFKVSWFYEEMVCMSTEIDWIL